jgi:hypothetical protein
MINTEDFKAAYETNEKLSAQEQIDLDLFLEQEPSFTEMD